jgi:hypothetical protein
MSGVTIEWRATTLQGTGQLVRLRGTGNFEVYGSIAGGHEAVFSGGGFEGIGHNIIIKNGGIVSSSGLDQKTIASEMSGGNVTVESGGRVEAPNGTAIHVESPSATITLNDTTGIQGSVEYDGITPYGADDWIAEVYGNVSIDENYWDIDATTFAGLDKVQLIIKSSSTVTIAKDSTIIIPVPMEWIVEKNATLIVKGRIKNWCKIKNHGRIIFDKDPGVYEGYEGSIYEETSTGKTINENIMTFKKDSSAIFNDLDNTQGHIYHEEGASLTGTENISGKQPEPLKATEPLKVTEPPSSGGSGGCSTGLCGIIALFAGIVALKKKTA